MGVKYGTDGTLNVNTVRYNYKQARNMIADGCYGLTFNSTALWNNAIVSTSPAGYKSYRAFKLTYNNLTQEIYPLVTSHIYYFSYYYRLSSSTTTACRIVAMQTSGGYQSVSSSASIPSTGGNWVHRSHRFVYYKASTDTGVFKIMAYTNADSSASNAYVSKFILIDLTDTFGAGNEPSLEWCDQNIREHEVYVNFGNKSATVGYNDSTSYTFSNWASNIRFNYQSLPGTWEPSDYMWYLDPPASSFYCAVYSAANISLTQGETTYFQTYVYLDGDRANYKQQFNLYWPEAEPVLGNVLATIGETFNGGGSMRGWNRVSMYGVRNSWSSGSYRMRFDFQNNYYPKLLRMTGNILLNPEGNITQYNSYNGTAIKLGDINKEWCDRWIDGRSSSIIHIKDPKKTTVVFNPNEYEILDYIESDGNQYIDTGVTATTTRNAVLVFSPNDVMPNGSADVLAAYDGTNKIYFAHLYHSSIGFSNTYNNSQVFYAPTPAVVGHNYVVSTYLDGAGVVMPQPVMSVSDAGTGKSDIVNTTRASATLSQTLYLFGRNNRGTFDYGFKGKMYNAMLGDGTVLGNLLNLVPARRLADGAIGMVDKPTGQFYENRGLGAFIAGPTTGQYLKYANHAYDVVCNDIEIRPEIKKVYFDSTGTIRCRKLVKTQKY